VRPRTGVEASRYRAGWPCSAPRRCGDQGPTSDVDLLAAFDKTRRISILDIAGMEQDLAAMLGCKVDLIEEGTLKPRVQQAVEAEAVRAF
jgi:predicted nucleotidyltransferase